MSNIDERWKAIFSAIGVIIVNAAALMGINISDGANLQDVLLGCAWLASILWAIWKNHNFTDAAAQGQLVTDAIKSIKKTTGEQVSAQTALELTGGAAHDDE